MSIKDSHKPSIPFCKISLQGSELDHIAKAVSEGHLSGNHFFTRQCEQFLQNSLAAPKALLTSSCTHALEMAAIALEIQAGDEVIVPSFSFVSTANAFAMRGARPVFIDIRPDTLNLDETKLEGLITEKTKAIVPVHYGGVACAMDEILKIAQKYQIPVIEDNAHGLFGKYKGKNLGTLGRLGTLSFHETKNITCGEGGALLVNDPEYFSLSEIVREKGTDRSQFFRGEVDKYSWVGPGSNYMPSELQSAFLLAQLENADAIQNKRRQIYETYLTGLSAWARDYGIGLPFIPEDCESAYHLFYLLLPNEKKRDELMEHLKQRGILAVFHYLPLHRSKMAKQLDSGGGPCPVTERVSAGLLRLPFYNHISEDEQHVVIEAIQDFRRF